MSGLFRPYPNNTAMTERLIEVVDRTMKYVAANVFILELQVKE